MDRLNEKKYKRKKLDADWMQEVYEVLSDVNMSDEEKRMIIDLSSKIVKHKNRIKR